jgi:ketosteroid isomerase-like protein
MSDVDEFLSSVLPRQHDADAALHNGDAEPRKRLWSHRDPVTVLGAAKTVSGWPEVEALFDWLASNFTGCASHELEVTAAGVSGDLGYIVGAERTTASVREAAPEPYALRVTLIFRREDGEWREVHRHADPLPGVESTAVVLGRLR